MAITQEQQSKLLEAYRQGKASGQTQEQSIASIKDYLVKSGQYDSAKTQAQGTQLDRAAADEAIVQRGGAKSGLNTEPPKDVQPLVSLRGQAPKVPGTPVAPSPTPSPTPTPTPTPVPLPTPSAPRGQAPKADGTPVAPATTPAEAPAVSPQRTQEIQKNLMDGSVNAKQNFTDVETFKRAYGYDQKPEAERAILDKFWSSYAEKNAATPVAPAPVAPTVNPTKNEAVMAVWNGQETPEMKADASYPAIKAAADKARKYAGMSTDELTGAIAGSQITEEQASLISKLDPSFGQKWEAAKAQYKLKIDTGVTNETAASLASSALGADAGENGVTPEKYEDPIIKAISEQIAALSSANLKTQAEKDAQAAVNEKKAKIDELTQQRDKIYEDLSKSYVGVPKSLLMAMAAEKAKPLNEQISTLTREANLALGQYNAAVEERQLAGDTAKTVASLNLEVAKRYADVQEARAKALQESMKAQKLDTKVETIDGRKVLINMQTGKQIADIGPDLADKKYELKEIGGKQYFVDSLGNKMPALGEGQYDWKASGELAKEYAGNAQAKNFMETAAQYNRMVELKSQAEQGKLAPGVFDIAVIKTMEKMLDPNSVVREGEFNNYLSAAGIKENVKSLYERLAQGGKIPDNIRGSLITAINSAYGSARDSIAPFQESFMKNIDSVNADPVRVFGGYWVSSKNASTASDYLKNQNSEPWSAAYSSIK